MTAPQPLGSPEEEEVKARCRAILAEVRRLRQFKRPAHGAPGEDVHQALIQVRGNLDQMEELLAQLMDLGTSAKIVAAEQEDLRQEAWDEQATAPAKPGSGAEYQGKEERYARWNLDTIRQARAARQARRVSDFITGIEKQVRVFYYGMTGLQDELKATLRYLPWEDNLSR